MLLHDLVCELNEVVDTDNPLKYKIQNKLYEVLRRYLTVHNPSYVCNVLEGVLDELVEKDVKIKPSLVNTLKTVFLSAVKDHYESVTSYAFDKYLRKSVSQKIIDKAKRLKKLAEEVSVDAVEDNYEDVGED